MKTASIAGGESVPQLAGAVFKNAGSGGGVLIAEIEQGSPAWRYGLREGDRIVAVNRKPVPSLEAFTGALQSAGRVLALNVLRGDERLFIVIQ